MLQLPFIYIFVNTVIILNNVIFTVIMMNIPIVIIITVASAIVIIINNVIALTLPPISINKQFPTRPQLHEGSKDINSGSYGFHTSKIILGLQRWATFKGFILSFFISKY